MKPNRKIVELLRNDSGTETLEWGIVAGVLVGVLILTLAAVGTWVKGAYDGVASELGA